MCLPSTAAATALNQRNATVRGRAKQPDTPMALPRPFQDNAAATSSPSGRRRRSNTMVGGGRAGTSDVKASNSRTAGKMHAVLIGSNLLQRGLLGDFLLHVDLAHVGQLTGLNVGSLAVGLRLLLDNRSTQAAVTESAARCGCVSCGATLPLMRPPR